MIGLILVIVLQYLTVLLDLLEIKCMHVNTITCTTASIQACSLCKLGGGCFSSQRTFTLVSVWIMQLSYSSMFETSKKICNSEMRLYAQSWNLAHLCSTPWSIKNLFIQTTNKTAYQHFPQVYISYWKAIKVQCLLLNCTCMESKHISWQR